jgi:hypothetical protein
MSISLNSITSQTLTASTANLKGTININTTGSNSSTISNTTISGPLRLNNGVILTNGTNTTTLTSPGTTTITFPTVQGSSTQTLTASDSNGTTSWTPINTAGAVYNTLITYADQINAASSNSDVVANTTGATVSVNNVWVGSSYWGPSSAPYTQFTIPATGTYSIKVSTFSGGKTVRITVVRSYTTVYDQVLAAGTTSGVLSYAFTIWNGFQNGDVITFFANETVTGNYPSSITDATVYKQKGDITIRKLIPY